MLSVQCHNNTDYMQHYDVFLTTHCFAEVTCLSCMVLPPGVHFNDDMTGFREYFSVRQIFAEVIQNHMVILTYEIACNDIGNAHYV